MIYKSVPFGQCPSTFEMLPRPLLSDHMCQTETCQFHHQGTDKDDKGTICVIIFIVVIVFVYYHGRSVQIIKKIKE